MKDDKNIYDIAIIGSGPSGLTAGIYASRANLKTLLLAGKVWGGQLMLTTEVENFPGFPDGIMGPELMMAMRKQAEKYGTEIIDVNFSQGDFSQSPFKLTTEDNQIFYSKSVIIATGADTKWLQIPGEKEKIGRGVSSCAPCDAAFYRNKNVIVVGGGDSAMEEATVLSKFANEITIVHRGDSFRASEIMQKRVMENPKIKTMFNTELTEILGENKVEKVKIKNNKTNEESEMNIDGVFVAIGHIPNSKVFPDIEVNEKGFIKRREGSKTNIEGVFVSGDVYDHKYMQAVTAAAYGCEAALDAEKWLEEQK